jgi:hypothetical protein
MAVFQLVYVISSKAIYPTLSLLPFESNLFTGTYQGWNGGVRMLRGSGGGTVVCYCYCAAGLGGGVAVAAGGVAAARVVFAAWVVLFVHRCVRCHLCSEPMSIDPETTLLDTYSDCLIVYIQHGKCIGVVMLVADGFGPVDPKEKEENRTHASRHRPVTHGRCS